MGLTGIEARALRTDVERTQFIDGLLATTDDLGDPGRAAYAQVRQVEARDGGSPQYYRRMGEALTQVLKDHEAGILQPPLDPESRLVTSLEAVVAVQDIHWARQYTGALLARERVANAIIEHAYRSDGPELSKEELRKLGAEVG